MRRTAEASPRPKARIAGAFYLVTFVGGVVALLSDRGTSPWLVLLAFGGLGWLTFLSPMLAGDVSPWNLAPGIIGEGALSLWLLAFGVNVPRWRERANGAAVLALRVHA